MTMVITKQNIQREFGQTYSLEDRYELESDVKLKLGKQEGGQSPEEYHLRKIIPQHLKCVFLDT